MKKIFPLIALVFALSGCLPTFQYPIVDSDNNTIDKRIYGMWEYPDSLSQNELRDDGLKYAFLQFLPIQNGVDITYFIYSDDDGPETMHFLGFPAIVDGIGYLNFREDTSTDDDSGYYLIKYEITDSKVLKITHVNEALLEQLISDKKIKGEKKDYETTITEERTALIEYITEHNIFNDNKPEYFKFKDIGLPEIKDEESPLTEAES